MNEKTEFNPFSGEENIIRSIYEHVSVFQNIKICQIAILSGNGTKLFIVERKNNTSDFSYKTFDLSPQILNSINTINSPVYAKMLDFCTEYLPFAQFVKKHLKLEESDYVVPVERADSVAIIAFINVTYSRHSYPDIQIISGVKEVMQRIIFTYDAIKTDREMQKLLYEANEKKDSYEMMVKKVEQVNDALTRLQEKQIQLIESERWISISQITVSLNHEINNPLMLILGMSQLIQSKMAKNINIPPNEFKKNITLIFDQCRKIIDIIKSLRRISVPVIEKYLPNIEMIKLEIEGDSKKE